MEAPSVPIGTQIGVYRIESKIGAGGMGSVYRAVHVKLGRRAAIKVLADPLAADPTYVSRFFHEARVVSEVGHPNIVDVIDFIEFESPERVAYVMELVDGPSLSRVVHRHHLSTPQIINISLQLLDVLAAVHKINVVHRDLKPDNILVVGSLDTDLSARPCIKVLDFGIAKIHSADAVHKTTTGMLLGTPAYMSPEQVAGEPVSSATDVYAFGEILYEMLARRRLFDGNARAILKAKVGDHAPHIELPNDIPDRHHFTSLILACLSPEQSARPSVPKLVEHLRPLLGGTPAVTPVIQRSEPLQPAPYQATLSGVLNTSVVAPPKGRAMLYGAAGIVALIASVVLAVTMANRQPEPVIVNAIPLEEPKKEQAAVPEPPPPPPAPPVEEKIEAPQIEAPKIEARKPEVRRRAPRKAAPRLEKQSGPLKKGEFPTW